MAEAFRFSPRPNRAAEIRWRPWGQPAFEEALSTDRPILLNITAVWCGVCHTMDETAYSDPELIQLANAELVPIRVDADRYPHVQERYMAGGWPTNAFLSPTGEVLWSGTLVAAEDFRAAAQTVVQAWRERRSDLQLEIERRRKALEAARSRRPAVGLVRREAAEDVIAAAAETFDPRNGGFGEEPKFPPAEVLELLFAHSARSRNALWREMAERTLHGILAGELWDPVDGGFFRFAAAADWTEPCREKLLEVNAGLIRAFALGAQLTKRADWLEIAERTAAWADTDLGREDGLWSASLGAPSEFFRLEGPQRKEQPRFPEPTLLTVANAAWIRALAEAGGRLDRPEWIRRAAAALETLLVEMREPGGLFFHYRSPGDAPQVPGLLVDAVEVAAACVALAQADGNPRWLDEARRIAAVLEEVLWADDGGFFDHVRSDDEAGLLRYRDRPFEENAAAARVFIDLELATGERSYRAIAERVLAVLSPLAGRYGVAAAPFALAVEEFFEPPLRVVVVGDYERSAPLRSAALALPRPDRRVWSLEQGGRIGPMRFPADEGPAAYVCGTLGSSAPVRDPGRLQEVAATAR